MIQVTTTWLDGIHFVSEDENGHSLEMDGSPEFGGQLKGFTPKKVLLSALAGCTGMDVVSILRKMQVDFDHFSMTTEGDVATDDPKVITHIRLVYRFKGQNLPVDKIGRAVQLSQEKYCAISSMLRTSTVLDYSILVE